MAIRFEISEFVQNNFVTLFPTCSNIWCLIRLKSQQQVAFVAFVGYGLATEIVPEVRASQSECTAKDMMYR